MNYTRIHDSIIDRARLRGSNKTVLNYYTEAHHILPRSLGGSDLEENIVLLTPREHFIVHILLWKIYPNIRQIAQAAILMSNRHKNKVNSKVYSKIRSYIGEVGLGEEFSQTMSLVKFGKTSECRVAGVFWNSAKNRWIAQAFKRIDGKAINRKLGSFSTEEEAINARLEWERSVNRDSIFSK